MVLVSKNAKFLLYLVLSTPTIRREWHFENSDSTTTPFRKHYFKGCIYIETVTKYCKKMHSRSIYNFACTPFITLLDISVNRDTGQENEYH